MKGMGKHEMGEVLQSFIPWEFTSVLSAKQFSFPALKRGDTLSYVCVVFCTDPLEMLITENFKQKRSYSSFET